MFLRDQAQLDIELRKEIQVAWPSLKSKKLDLLLPPEESMFLQTIIILLLFFYTKISEHYTIKANHDDRII